MGEVVNREYVRDLSIIIIIVEVVVFPVWLLPLWGLPINYNYYNNSTTIIALRIAVIISNIFVEVYILLCY